jgi:hypothetical protein
MARNEVSGPHHGRRSSSIWRVARTRESRPGEISGVRVDQYQCMHDGHDEHFALSQGGQSIQSTTRRRSISQGNHPLIVKKRASPRIVTSEQTGTARCLAGSERPGSATSTSGFRSSESLMVHTVAPFGGTLPGRRRDRSGKIPAKKRAKCAPRIMSAGAYPLWTWR